MTNFVQQHSERVSVLAAKLYEGLISGDEGAYVAKTGSLLRSKTLRSRETRKAFAVIVQAAVGSPCEEEQNDRKEKRFWSKRVVLDALKLMVKDRQLQVPQLPGFQWPEWFKEQSGLVHKLAKKASRNTRIFRSKSMAEEDTQPYDQEDCSVKLGSKVCKSFVGTNFLACVPRRK